MSVVLKRRLLTVDEYHLMGEVGILNDRGIELINGEIIEMSPIGSRHAAIVEKVKDLLVIHLQGKAIVRVQNPLITSTLSEPEPDIAVVKFRSDYYLENHPKSEDTYLIIEVADSSLEYDREIKLPLYASDGISEVWIMDLNSKQIEVYHSPQNDKYQHSKVISLEEKLSAQLLDFSALAKNLFI